MKVKYEVISALASTVLKGLDKSVKYRRYNYDPKQSPAIYALWHGWQLCFGGLHDRNKLHALISPSKDGEIIAYTAIKFGFSTIRGSLGRGGARATRKIIKAMEEGKNIGYTVDGPRGPAFKVKKGLIKIAQMTQKPIISMNAAFRDGHEFKSWDKFQIPYPGAKIALVFAKPLYIPKDLSDEELENYRLKVESDLFKLREEALIKIKLK